jgi:hypothetical protein
MKYLTKISVLSLIIAFSINLSANAQRDSSQINSERSIRKAGENVNQSNSRVRKARKASVRKPQRRAVKRNVVRRNHRRNSVSVRSHQPRRVNVFNTGFHGYYGPTQGLFINTRSCAGRIVRPVARRVIHRNNRRFHSQRASCGVYRPGVRRTCS